MENFSESGDSSLNYEEEEDDDDDDDESMRGSETLAERLQKAGYNYKSLLTVSLKKNDSNDSYATYNPPLIASLFDYVPPVINFVTQDEKGKKFEEFFIENKVHNNFLKNKFSF